jgi:hypothetical protein
MPILDFFNKDFEFFEPGGTAHLLPGRPLEQSAPFTLPQGAGFFVTLSSFTGAFVHPDKNLTQRPLGLFSVSVGVRTSSTLVCRVRLTDENMDDPILIRVRAFVTMFT